MLLCSSPPGNRFCPHLFVPVMPVLTSRTSRCGACIDFNRCVLMMYGMATISSYQISTQCSIHVLTEVPMLFCSTISIVLCVLFCGH